MTSLFAKSRKRAEEGEKIKGKDSEGQLAEGCEETDLQVVLRSRLEATGPGFFWTKYEAKFSGLGWRG